MGLATPCRWATPRRTSPSTGLSLGALVFLLSGVVAASNTTSQNSSVEAGSAAPASSAAGIAGRASRSPKPSSAEPGLAPSRKETGPVAICLAGGLRMFELTAYGIVKHVFQAYSPAHVFISTPADENTHKLLLLQSLKLTSSADNPSAPWEIKGVNVVAQEPLDEHRKGASLLGALGSPNGIQGLLQYFQLVENCVELIQEAETAQNISYSWIIRTRPDGFWNGPAPPIWQFPPSNYSFPEGSCWGGINDRFAAALKPTALEAMKRLSVLGALASLKLNLTGLNSEAALLEHLKLRGIGLSPMPLNFCTLSHRSYRWPLSLSRIPTFSIGSAGPLNGAKCRPCHPKVKGRAALIALSELDLELGRPFINASTAKGAYDLCQATGPWTHRWESIFDMEAGEATARVRVSYGAITEQSCRANLSTLLGSIPRYSGPTAATLCQIEMLTTVFRALNTKTAVTVAGATVKDALQEKNQSFLGQYLRLSSWKGDTLPLPQNGSETNRSPCVLLLRLHVSEESQGKKPRLVNVMRMAQWELIKCAGGLVEQFCFFLR